MGNALMFTLVELSTFGDEADLGVPTCEDFVVSVAILGVPLIATRTSQLNRVSE